LAYNQARSYFKFFRGSSGHPHRNLPAGQMAIAPLFWMEDCINPFNNILGKSLYRLRLFHYSPNY
jgi:hypothetical protein